MTWTYSSRWAHLFSPIWMFRLNEVDRRGYNDSFRLPIWPRSPRATAPAPAPTRKDLMANAGRSEELKSSGQSGLFIRLLDP
ncbi:hypothetical protein GN956_G17534 [Arapaima gigas]